MVRIAGNPTSLIAEEGQKPEQDLGHSAGMGSNTQVSNDPPAGSAGGVGQTELSMHNL
jgi:hypothetical protein